MRSRGLTCSCGLGAPCDLLGLIRVAWVCRVVVGDERGLIEDWIVLLLRVCCRCTWVVILPDLCGNLQNTYA